MHGHDHTPLVSYRGSSGLQLHSIPVIVDARSLDFELVPISTRVRKSGALFRSIL